MTATGRVAAAADRRIITETPITNVVAIVED
jgi:hypothetical protein